MKRAKDVEEYIMQQPADMRPVLRELRQAIRDASPEAEEKISYSMPYYGYKGRLVYFRLSKKHIGLYIPPPIVENHQKDLKGYVTARSTIQFPIDKKLPISLIKKLVKARAMWNEKQVK